MVKRLLLPLSLTHQVAMLMLLLGLLGIAGMGISSWMSQNIQGNAHAINKAGSLRMQSYRLLSMVPLSNSSHIYLDDLERDEANSDLQQAVLREGLSEPFSQLRTFWQTQLRPQLQQASRPDEAASDVAAFVAQLDALVSAIDHSTEERIALVTKIQRLFIALMGMVLLATILYLRHRLLTPLRKLVAMAQAIGHGDFSERISLSLKIHVSCIRMQGGNLSDEVRSQLTEMREELNTAYRQLSELLTTFRLQLNESCLLAALRATVEEYEKRLGFPLRLHYQLPQQAVSAHQGIHVLQIVREALGNIYKHAQATEVDITLIWHEKRIELTVRDNGIGIVQDSQCANHYGLIIMRDRAHSLHGECVIARHQDGGTQVKVTFDAENRYRRELTGGHHDE
ncbi:ATP-binding protein [Candidatus Symbiopectobacterium sp.]|uniref:ATP-binding protein n=1 Tax=Candidatus Symbiopectobacterium sp. TaxID=2816440 RepID=UPI0025BF77B0|nr:ATP-binding protein [Candidatus Symbiopectobacterium sp.]